MKYIVYILQNDNNKYYIGQTSNLQRRIDQHNSRECRSTKSGVLWKLVYSQGYQTRSEAMKREKQIKSYKGGNAFKDLLTK